MPAQTKARLLPDQKSSSAVHNKPAKIGTKAIVASWILELWLLMPLLSVNSIAATTAQPNEILRVRAQKVIPMNPMAFKEKPVKLWAKNGSRPIHRNGA